MGVAQGRADKLKDLRVVIAVNAGEEGRLFGSIGTRDIADAVTAAGVEVNKAEVRMPHGALREVGEFVISIDLGHEVAQNITLAIVPA